MAESPTTQPSLLVRLRDAGDNQAWGQFVDVYAPLVYGYLRKHGQQDADAADLTQEVLKTVAATASRFSYDRGRGTFRGWLFTVVRSRLCDFLKSNKNRIQGTGDSGTLAILDNQPAKEHADSAQWDQEYEQRLFTWAAEQIRGEFQDSTWQAFWQTAVDGSDAKSVAESLGISVGAVYISKSRVLSRMRQQIESVQEE